MWCQKTTLSAEKTEQYLVFALAFPVPAAASAHVHSFRLQLHCVGTTVQGVCAPPLLMNRVNTN